MLLMDLAGKARDSKAGQRVEGSMENLGNRAKERIQNSPTAQRTWNSRPMQVGRRGANFAGRWAGNSASMMVELDAVRKFGGIFNMGAVNWLSDSGGSANHRFGRQNNPAWMQEMEQRRGQQEQHPKPEQYQQDQEALGAENINEAGQQGTAAHQAETGQQLNWQTLMALYAKDALDESGTEPQEPAKNFDENHTAKEERDEPEYEMGAR